MPSVNLSVLNQRQTPALYADTFANIPPAGYLGRIFWSTDTFAIYRDNGTGWDLFGGPGTGTVTGTGTTGQIAIWNGSTVIGGTGTTGTGSVVLSNSPALSSPSFTSVNVTGGIAAMPTGSGTLLYSSALGSYVPYTGATTDLNLGTKNITAYQFISTNNISGDKKSFQVGDDTWLGDGNVSNTLFITGQQAPTTAYIRLGSDAQNLGFDGTNFGYTGNFNAAGFKVNGKTDSFFVLAGGGTVATSSFAPATGGAYLPLAGGNLTGVVNSTTRLNLGGAVDDVLYTLNVSGKSVFSNTIGIGGVPEVNTLTTGNIGLNGGGAAFGYSSSLYLTANLYYNLNFTYKATAAASLLNLTNGGLILYTAPSGTINNTATITKVFEILQTGVINATGRFNANGATDNSIYAINSLGCINSNALSLTGSTVSTNQNLSTNTVFVFNGGAGITWTLENPSGNNRIIYVKNFGSANLTVAAFAGTHIVDAGGALQTSVQVNVGKTTVFWQDGNVKSYELSN